MDAYKEIKLVMEEASKFMDEEIPLAIEAAEEGTAGIQTWLQPSTLIKSKGDHFMTKRGLGVACSRHQNRPCCCRTCAI